MITLKDVSFGYERSKPVLDKIGLNVAFGRIYGLLGKGCCFEQIGWKINGK